jgi:D-alanyl-D-alanine carboxypeptidase/D-alanyl-D-alanine-endopeptidase (penicillin-binding protein 4)
MNSFWNKKISLKYVLLSKLTLILLFGLILFSLFNSPVAEEIKKTLAEKKQAKLKAAAQTQSMQALKAALDSIANAEEMVAGTFGFQLATVDSNKALFSYNATHSLIPASVLKIVTTGVALSELGNNFHFTTLLQYDGKIDPATHILNGNIYIHGGGDPSLGSDEFASTTISVLMENWVAAIRKQGIDSINGSIIGDAEIFEQDPIPAGWAWEDIESWYGIGTCGLNFHENTYDINVTCSKNNPLCKVTPSIPGLNLHNQMVVNPSVPKNYMYVMGAPFMDERVLLGEVNSDYEDKSAIPDPAYTCAYTLEQSLRENGIGICDSSSTVRRLKLKGVYERKERKTFFSTYSPSLASLVYYTNNVSQNFYAESILKALSVKSSGYGSTAGGVNAVIKFWKEKNIDLRGFYMTDGSGVSRYDGVTAKQLVDFLVEYKKDPVLFPVFYASLPVAGESGTIRKLAKETSAQGNLRAKSGTMSRVRSYTGYVKDKRGRMLAFAMISNNHNWDPIAIRDRMEYIMVKMAELE